MPPRLSARSEAGEVDLGEVVDGLPGEVANRPDRRLAPASRPALSSSLRLLTPSSTSFLFGLRLAEAVRLFDLDGRIR